MRNITTEVKGGRLLISVDISEKALKAAQPSASGKSRVVATTGGLQHIDGADGIKLGLNVTTK